MAPHPLPRPPIGPEPGLPWPGTDPQRAVALDRP